MAPTASHYYRPLAGTVGLVLAAAILRLAGASRAQIAAAVADPQAYVTATGPDEFVLALATALGWLLLCWVSLGALLVLGSAAPGLLGWLFHQLARLLLPATLRRFVSLALGVTLLTGTSVASAAPPTTLASITVTTDWPGTPESALAATPDWPPAPVAETGPPEQPAPDLPASSDQPRSAGPGEYAVQPGDCLWDIVERALAQAGSPIDAASVAAAVANWWQVNRRQIEDPDLIFPGQILAVPAPRP
ncbi:MAG: LysM peptidoglycan-binding domain-containing protein [Actinomycetota bacterium]|nr:LysM peptidoglycan-binding domain-containing protein [Actinomycetota bacterium]